MTLHGITVYQASFADGGSDLTFKAWNLADADRTPVKLKATSMREFPLDLGKASYKLEFDQFTSMNVEDMSEPSEKEQNLKSALNDVRSVRQEDKNTPISARLSFTAFATKRGRRSNIKTICCR